MKVLLFTIFVVVGGNDYVIDSLGKCEARMLRGYFREWFFFAEGWLISYSRTARV